MNKGKALLLTAAMCMALAGCGGGEEAAVEEQSAVQQDGTERTATVFAMDTVMDLKIFGGSDDLLNQAQDRIMELEGILSTTNEESEIYALNKDGKGKVSDETKELLGNALEMCRKTDGALDVSIYPVVREWGFTTGEYKVPAEETIQELLSHVDYKGVEMNGSKVTLAPEAQIDLGSVAKGYTADQVAALFKDAGITSGLLNLGGNVQAIGKKPDGTAWNVAIQDPKGSDPMAMVSVEDSAVVTSGDYERFFEEGGKKYWHIMDPETGHPADKGISSVTIVTKSGFYADALSTSMFVMGLEKGSEFWRNNKDFEAVFITNDGEFYVTEGLEGSFSFIEPYQDKTYTVIK